ncbi:MAG: DUF3822 family protein [Chryseolinea sp.]
MQTSTLQYKLIKKIKDDRFDEELINQYHLLIHIGTRDFQMLVLDPDQNRVLLMEDFVLPGISTHNELMLMLDQLFDSHAVLKAGFWKRVKVSIKNQKFVQVPQALFSESSLEEYLKFNAPIDPANEEFLASPNPRCEAVTVFAINKELKDWLTSIYPNSPPAFTHQSAALIEGTMQFAEGKNDNPLYVYIDRFKLHILSCKDGKLLYYNQFAIKQFSDYVKYIMMVMKTLNLNQESSQVVLWGYIGKNSPHYVEFYKYINNVTFGGRPRNISFGYMFDEVQEHHFFDLYSISLID